MQPGYCKINENIGAMDFSETCSQIVQELESEPDGRYIVEHCRLPDQPSKRELKLRKHRGVWEVGPIQPSKQDHTVVLLRIILCRRRFVRRLFPCVEVLEVPSLEKP
ncbi:unnamed protein product, partial [Ectocarpus sp. 12 AP-2014]